METGSRLTVRAYHVTDVEYGEENRVTVDGKLTVCRETAEEILAQGDGGRDPGKGTADQRDQDPDHPAGGT